MKITFGKLHNPDPNLDLSKAVSIVQQSLQTQLRQPAHNFHEDFRWLDEFTEEDIGFFLGGLEDTFRANLFRDRIENLEGISTVGLLARYIIRRIQFRTDKR